MKSNTFEEWCNNFDILLNMIIKEQLNGLQLLDHFRDYKRKWNRGL